MAQSWVFLLLVGQVASSGPCEYLHMGTPPENHAEALSVEEYDKALQSLDMEAVKADMTKLLADSQECWPADFGNYGPFMVRLAWHCAGSFRSSDGVGGCGGGRMRFEPERSWPDNTNLDKARALVYPLKLKYGDALSWGDLFILAGTTALRDAGAPLKQMCFGRIDDTDGSKSQRLGPTALQAERMPCVKNGECKLPLGATTIGLIYVNPEGPMGNPDPVGSAKDIRQTFVAMGHSDRNTVALIGGGHAVGKSHGACPEGPGLPPNEAYVVGEATWTGQCGTGKGADTVTSGFEGSWTLDPLKWDNEYYQALLANTWEKHKGPGGHWQWRIKGGDPAGADRMRLTSDIALLNDGKYLAIVEEFATNMDAFNEAFDEAWLDLTTTYGSGTWSASAKCDSGSLPKPRMRDDDVEMTATAEHPRGASRCCYDAGCTSNCATTGWCAGSESNCGGCGGNWCGSAPAPTTAPTPPAPTPPAPTPQAPTPSAPTPSAPTPALECSACKSLCSDFCAGNGGLRTNQCWGTPVYTDCTCANGQKGGFAGCPCENAQCPSGGSSLAHRQRARQEQTSLQHD